MDSTRPGTDQDTSEEKIWVGWVAKPKKNPDLKLMSSDGYSFWVESKDLAQNSPVFASMLATCDKSSSHATLNLTDPGVEYAANLTIVLRVIEVVNQPVLFSETLIFNSSDDMVSFALKYEMKSVLDAVKMEVFNLVTSFPPRGTGFILSAARIKEWNLCGRLVALLDHTIERPDESELDNYSHTDNMVNMRKLFDWRSWTPASMRVLSEISEEFLWAVMQTGTRHTQGDGPVSYKPMGQSLAFVMKKIENGEIKFGDWAEGDGA